MKFIVLKKVGSNYFTKDLIFSSEKEVKKCVALLNNGGIDSHDSYCYAEIKEN